ncbi:MAG: glycosyltransferase family 2 protein [Vampirovibrionales bacterium]
MKQALNVLVLLAGSSQAFTQQGFVYPKYLTEVRERPLVQYVLESFQPLMTSTTLAPSFHFLMLKDDADTFHLDHVIKLLMPEASMILVEGNTKGAACTALLAVDTIDTETPLLVVNGDHLVQNAYPEAIEHFMQQTLEGGIVTFESVHPRFSYVRLDDTQTYVLEVAEKRPISKHATAGVYYFAQGKAFVQSAMRMIEKDAHVNGHYYLAPSYNELILAGGKVGIYPIPRPHYTALATPDDVKAFMQHQQPLPAMASV